MSEKYKRPDSEKPLVDLAEEKESGPDSVAATELNSDLKVTHNSELQYYHYLSGTPPNVQFEMYLADEAKSIAQKIGWKRLRRLLEGNLAAVDSDPFGERSIDPRKERESSQIRRSVNKGVEAIEDLVGPIAIKGTGKNEPGEGYREDLKKQFLTMRKLELDSQSNLSEEERAILRFLPVYGIIRYPVPGPQKYQEWLLMERVEEAQQVQDIPFGEPIFLDQHPRLARVLTPDRATYRWADIERELERRGLHVEDLKGRNVLWTLNEQGEKVYSIIDQLEVHSIV